MQANPAGKTKHDHPGGETMNCKNGRPDSIENRGEGKPVSSISTLVPLLLLSLAVLQPVRDAQAQAVAYKAAPAARQPTILNAGNGVPVINIQTPNAKGLSHNAYSQFDVQSQGTILNNSRNNVSTQLGGWIQGNPWLAAGTASLILNEVFSERPSYLGGLLEVAGDPAQVIVANPAGITCSGCGFLNAHRATLTTGVPLIDDGALTGYRVESGTIRIEGAGLDARQASAAEIIARAVEINAGLWADALRLTTGANEVDAQTAEPAQTLAGSGPAPEFALDVAQLGGMYANKIRLIGTEAGVGVRNAGTIAAQTGEVHVTADGQLINRGTLIGQQTQIEAAGIANSGTLAGQTRLGIESRNEIANAGLMQAGREIRLQAGGQIDNQGEIDAQRLEIRATSLANEGAIRQSGAQALAIETAQLTNAAGARIGAPQTDADQNTPAETGETEEATPGEAGQPSIETGAGLNETISLPVHLADGIIAIESQVTNAGQILANGSLALTTQRSLDNAGELALDRLQAQGEILRNSGNLLTQEAAIDVAALDNAGGRIEAAQLSLAARQIDNAQGALLHSGADDLSLNLTGNLDNRQGIIASNAANLQISAAEIDNAEGQIEHAGAGELLMSAQTLDNQGGRIAAGGRLSLTARNGLDNAAGRIEAADGLTIEAQGIENAEGVIVGQTLDINAQGQKLDNSGGIIAANETVTIDSGEIDNSEGAIQAGTHLTIDTQGQTLDNAKGTLYGQGDITIDAGAIGNVQGQILAGGDIGITAQGEIDNAEGAIHAGGHLAADTQGAALGNRGGAIQAQGRLDLATGDIDNAAGLIHSGETLTLAAGAIGNQSGRIAAGNNLDIAAQGAIDNSDGTLAAVDGQLTLDAQGELDNAAGRIEAAQSLAIDAQGINNAEGIVIGQTLQIDAQGQKLDNSAGILAAEEAVAIQSGEIDNSEGVIQAGTNLTIDTQGQALDNTGGTLYGQNAVTLDAGRIGNAQGQILAGDALALDAASLDNNQGEITADSAAELTIAGRFDNRSGTLAAADALTLDAASLDNAQGQITANAAARLAIAGRLDNRAGQIVAASNLDVSAQGAIDNAGGTLAAVDGQLTLSAQGELNNAAGRIEAAQNLSIDAQGVNNAEGAIIGQTLDIDAQGQKLDNTGGILAAEEAVAIQSGEIDNSEGVIQAGTNLTVNTHGQTLDNTGGTLYGQNAVTLDAGAIGNAQGQILAGDALTLTAASLDNAQGQITANAAAELAIAGRLDNRAGQIVAGSDLEVSAQGAIDNAAGTLAAVDGQLTLTAQGELNNAAGRIEAADSLSITARGVKNAEGSIIGQTLQIDAQGQKLDNTSGILAAEEAVTIDSGEIGNAQGTIQAGTNLTANTHGQALDNRNAQILALGAATLTAGDIGNQGGRIAGNSLALTADALDNRSGALEANDGLDIRAREALDNRRGRIVSNAALNIETPELDNSQTDGEGQGIEARSLSIAARNVDNRSGRIAADESVSIAADVRIDNAQGRITSPGEIVLSDSAPRAARTLIIDNEQGQIVAGESLTIEAKGLTGEGRILSYGDLALDSAEDIENTGELAARNLHLGTAGQIANSGLLQADETLSLEARSLTNAETGSLIGQTVDINVADALTNRGLIDGSETHIRAGALDNLGAGRIYGDHLAIAAETLNNLPENGAAPVIAARERLDIGAATIDNRDEALIFSAGDLAIGRRLDGENRATGQAQAIDNVSATIEALGDLSIDTASLVNRKTAFAWEQQETAGQPSGAELLDYLPELQFHWPISESSATAWRNLIRERYLNVITKLLGGGPSAELVASYNTPVDEETGYVYLNTSQTFPNVWGNLAGYDGPVGGGLDADVRDALTAAVNAQPLLSLADSHTIWQILIDTLEAQRPDLFSRLIEAAAQNTSRVAYRQVCSDIDDDCSYVDDITATYSYRRDVLTQDSPAAVIRSGQDMAIAAGTLRNEYSLIQSGGDMWLTGDTLTNIGAEFYLYTDASTISRHWHWVSRNHGSTAGSSSEQTLIGGSPAIISANGNLSIAFTSQIDNQTVRQNAGQVVATGSAPGATRFADASASADGANQAQAIEGAAAARTVEAADTSSPESLARTAAANADTTPGAAGEYAAAGSGHTSTPRVIQVAAENEGASSVIATVEQTLTLPSNSLYHVAPESTATYLIETDPLFTNYRNWLTSDYMLDALGITPSADQKRLGDGFYEQRLITEQVAQLTGRRFLEGYANDEEQYKALMNAGLTYAKEWNLIPGIALTAEQMAQLTTDIVWLVEREIMLADGTTQSVLVPQVYACVRENDLAPTGALIAANNVQIDVQGDIVNSGTLAGREIVALTAENIDILRGRVTGQDVLAQANNDLNVIGGTIEAER
ncbi:MAG: filamentous hemagglutinin N-terminal domain-containing protein, partial [Candidatus Accumulibacter sp.]|nr:filamentous hemagglutinin N-terminal domain-containing protein [Accumulibacter sp.]